MALRNSALGDPPLPNGVEVLGRLVWLHRGVRLEATAIDALSAFVGRGLPKVVVLVEIGTDTPPPGPELRRLISERLLDSDSVSSIGWVHEGDSLRARLVRKTLGGFIGAWRRWGGGGARGAPELAVHERVSEALARAVELFEASGDHESVELIRAHDAWPG